MQLILDDCTQKKAVCLKKADRFYYAALFF